MIIHALCGLHSDMLAKDARLSPAELATLSGPALLFVYIAALLAVGFVVDCVNRRGPLVGSSLLVVAGCLLIFPAKGFELTWLGYALQGAGEAGTVVATIAILGDLVRKRNWPVGYATYATAVLLSPVLGAASAVVLSRYDWRQSMLVVIGLYVPVMILAVRAIPARLEPAPDFAAWKAALVQLRRTPSYLLLAAAACLYLLTFVPLLGWAPVVLAAHGFDAAHIAELIEIIASAAVPVVVLASGPMYRWARGRAPSFPLFGGGIVSLSIGILVLIVAGNGAASVPALIATLAIAPAVNPLFLFIARDLTAPAGRSTALALILACQILCVIGLIHWLPYLFDEQKRGAVVTAHRLLAPLMIVASAWIAAVFYAIAGKHMIMRCDSDHGQKL